MSSNIAKCKSGSNFFENSLELIVNSEHQVYLGPIKYNELLF